MLRLEVPDLVPALLASCDGMLKNFDLRWYPDAALTVVMAAKGYPGMTAKGSVIEGLDDAARGRGGWIFHAGTKGDGGGTCSPMAAACSTSARAARRWARRERQHYPRGRPRWPDGFCRRDIGFRAVERESSV